MTTGIVWALWAGNWFALIAVIAIGVNLITQKTKRRAEGVPAEGGRRGDDAVATSARHAVAVETGDPINLRRVRPRAGRLSGAVLIVAALYLIANLAPLLTLP